MKRLIAVLALASSLAAADVRVLVTEHGKTYHSAKTCMSLSRSTSVHDVTEAAAVSHGLTKCRICWRAPKAKGADKSGWMKDSQ